MAPRLMSRTVEQPTIGAQERARMLALMQLCYEGVDPERFHSDLQAKQHVILLHDRATAELVGFSTLRVSRERRAAGEAEIIFSGDTVLHPDYWGQKILDTAFARFLLSRKLRRPFGSVRWLLLSGGYKTYLMIINYFPVTSPRRDREPSAREVDYRNQLCGDWFGRQFDPSTGILRFAQHYRVRNGVAPIDREAAAHPDIAFFAERNSGHGNGDELVCIAEVRLRDLGRAVLRIAGRRARRALAQGGRLLAGWARA